MAAETTTTPTPTRHRPKSFTVFAAAFIAGAAAAVGVNRVLDVQLAQRRPQVECEPIFVALRPLPQGAPVTVWDVALKDWPKAMLPSSALRSGDTFEGCVLRHPVREGQPLLSVQLVRSGATASGTVAAETFTAPVPAAATAAPSTSTQSDPWMPAESVGQPPAAASPPVAQTPSPAPVRAETPRPSAVTPESVAPSATPDSIAATTEATPPEATTAATEAATPVAEPSPAPAPASEPTTVVAEAGPAPSSPTDIEPTTTAPTAAAPTVADQDDDDLSEAVATDVQSMPSVMTTNGQPVAESARPSTGDAGRYLVVPERIALQADTSFTTPRPQPPGPPAATATPARSAQPQPAQTTARRGQTARPQTTGRQQPTAKQPAQPAPTQKAAAPQRSWGGMFPNVAAGIEAMGAPWQRSRSAATQPTAPSPPTRR
jgi:hypothetical protein